MSGTEAAIDDAVAAARFGRPTAAKRGRDPRWPYVPVVDFRYDDLPHGGHTTQIRGLAYATREEAVEAARLHIERGREALAADLADPRHRALREHHGLPRELTRA